MLLFFIIYSVNIRTLFRFSKLDCTFLFIRTNIHTAKCFILLLQVTCEQCVCQAVHNCSRGYIKKFGFVIHACVTFGYFIYLTYSCYSYTLCNTNNTYIKIYIDLHILIYQLTYTTLCKYAIQYIKEQHNNNAFNAIKKVLNHRLCYAIITV